MLRVKPSRAVVENLRAIDEIKAQIAALPVPSKEALQRLESEFVLETVYYANKIDGSELSKEETERALSSKD